MFVLCHVFLLSFLIPMFKTVSTHIFANQNYPIKVLSAKYLQKEQSNILNPTSVRARVPFYQSTYAK